MSYSLSRATAWNLAGYIYLILASFISTPIILHNLGVSEFARYAVIVATLTLLSAFDLGLPQAVVRSLVRTHDAPARQTLWATSSLLFVTTGIITGIIAVIIISSYKLSTLYYLLIFSLALLNNLVSHYMTLPQSTGHFGYFNVKTFLVGTGNTLFAAYLSQVGQGVPTILTAVLFCYLITLCLLAYFSLKYFPTPWRYTPQLKLAKSLVSFGLRNQVGKVAGQIQAQYAKYLLAPVSSLFLSAYAISTGLTQKLAGAVSQVATALYPQVSARPIRSLYYRLQLALIALALIGIIIYSFFGYAFISWWLHDPTLVELVDSALRVLVWNFVLLIPTPLASTVLDGLGHPGTTSLFATLTLALEITLALLFLPRLGLLAPIYANLIALSLTTPILLYVTDKYLLQSSHALR